MGIKEGGAGRPLTILEKVRENYPIILHGVSMSIGSTDEIDREYLARLKSLIQTIEPEWVSDHVCWTGVHGENLHDLLPLPYTTETVNHVADRIKYIQDYLGRRFVVENVSAYISFSHSEMTEWEFLSELCKKADCELLLDVNNIYVTSINQSLDPEKFLHGIPVERVRQMHLAGHSQGESCLIDTHDAPVTNDVWKLYEKAVRRFGKIPTLIEWDDKIPDFPRLQEEAARAHKIWNARK
jgi:uncharacterized protein (UPF0276 family)